jgi:hypothetical protein
MSQRNDKFGSSAHCPACGSRVFFRRPPKRGQNVTCRECESLLSVVRTSPIQLQWAFEDPFDDERLETGNGRAHASERAYDDYDDYEYFDEDYDSDLD